MSRATWHVHRMNLAIDREEQRERDAGASLEDTRVRERDAMEEVSTLQRSLTSSVAEWQESAPSWRGDNCAGS